MRSLSTFLILGYPPCQQSALRRGHGGGTDRNLLVLHSGHEKSLAFLKSLPPIIRKQISNLDIKFHYNHDFADEDQYKCCFFSNLPAINDLVDYISKNMRLSKLHLTLDLLDTWTEFFENYFTAVEWSLYKRAMERLGKSLGKLHGLKSSHVFLPVHTAYEETLERLGMGDEHYDSLRDCKLPKGSRDWKACHALPETKKSKYRARQFVDMATHIDAIEEDMEQILDNCSHPEWFEGIPIIPCG